MFLRKGKSACLLCALTASALVTSSASAQYKPKDTEWPSYAADLAGTRYRPLNQINASNFNDLEIAWRIKTDSFGDRPEYKLEGTPLMVNGVLYATAGSRRAVIALDPESGELLWPSWINLVFLLSLNASSRPEAVLVKTSSIGLTDLTTP